MKIVLLIFVFITLTFARHFRIKNRICPIDIPIAHNFDIKKFGSVTWYEVMKSINPYQLGKECGSLQPFKDASETSAFFTGCTSDDGRDYLCQNVTFSLIEPEAQPRNGEISVFMHKKNVTVNVAMVVFDFEHFVIMNECRNIRDEKSIEHVWALARENEVSEDLMKLIRDTIDKYFDLNDIKVANGNCMRQNLFQS